MKSAFDSFAAKVAGQVASAWFFAACVVLVLVWLPSIFIVPDTVPGKVDTWQLVINTATTIVTFLMVALLQNTQDRSTKAMTHKMDKLLAAVADVLDNTDGVDESGALATELREMVGVEMESSE